MAADALSIDKLQNDVSSSVDEANGEALSLPQLLKFQIIPSTDALLPLAQFAEVLKVPVNSVIPIPHMPAYVMGVYNWRGTVLWMIDLGLLLGMMPCHKYQGARSVHSTLVIERKDEASVLHQVGLVVHDITDTVQIDPATISNVELSNLPESLTRFLSGYWMNEQGEMLAVLDDEAIFSHLPTNT